MTIVLIILDGCGIGALPDSPKYDGDGVESNTIKHVAEYMDGDIKLKNFEKMGLGILDEIPGVPPVKKPLGAYGKCASKNPGKDTVGGHFEMTGVLLKNPYPVYTEGIPRQIMEKFEKTIGMETLGNGLPASGTQIIQELGKKHVETGRPIVYTSADSVFQIAAHEEVIPLDDLYEMCKKARKMLKGKHAIGRVIARPFIGRDGQFVRTVGRRDYPLEPPKKTLLDKLKKRKKEVIAIGKISDIFSHRGITKEIPMENNIEGIHHLLAELEKHPDGLIIINLIDFDMLYGHRNNPKGFYWALKEFDNHIPKILAALNNDDILFITADHGCDPTITSSTDHTREYIPIFVLGKHVRPNVDLGVRETFGDIGQTIAEYFGIKLENGQSFLKDILKRNAQAEK
ncbi:MAG: phosphopentomutase [Candidatus Helarchaeota archaeon]